MEKLVSLDTGLIFWTWTTFLIVLVILATKAWGPMIQALERRQHNIAEAMAAADKARAETEEMSAKYEQQLRAGRVEAQEILTEARVTAQKLRAGLEATAHTKADEIVASAQERIEAEKVKAIAEIRATVVDLSLEIAGKVLERNITSADNQKLAEASLRQIGKA